MPPLLTLSSGGFQPPRRMERARRARELFPSISPLCSVQIPQSNSQRAHYNRFNYPEFQFIPVSCNPHACKLQPLSPTQRRLNSTTTTGQKDTGSMTAILILSQPCRRCDTTPSHPSAPSHKVQTNVYLAR